MKKLFVLTSITMILFSCEKKGKLERKIESEITENCKGESCQIDLSKITPFKWSKFYAFNEGVSLEKIESAINQPYHYPADIERRLIFLDENNNIVYHEDVIPDIERTLDKQIVFDMPDSVNFRMYTNPIFFVSKGYLGNGRYFYILNQ